MTHSIEQDKYGHWYITGIDYMRIFKRFELAVKYAKENKLKISSGKGYESLGYGR